MCAGYFLVLLDVTIVNVALPSIRTGLHAGVAGLQWVVDGYAVALAALMLAAGTAGDVYGHRRVVLAGLALFGVASLGCGVAPTTAALVAARVAQGVGAALLLPGTLAVITSAFREPGGQARAIGVCAAIGSVALPAGPLLGGLLIAGLGWRTVFLVNVPIVAVAFVASMRVVPRDTTRADRRLDRPGVALAALLLGALTLAFIEAPRDGAIAAGAGAVAVVALAAFIAVERSARGPMLPLALFRRPAFSAANAVALTMNLVTLGMLFVTTLFLQAIQGRSALEAGLALIPLFAPLSLLASFVGRWVARVGPRLPALAGLIVSAAGIALLLGVEASTGYGGLVVAFLLWGAGLGLLTPAVVAAAMGAVPSSRSGLASAVNNTARQAGGAIGIAAFGSLAGAPSSHAGFISGMHTAAGVGTGLYLAAAALAAVALPRGRVA
jgi:DHA2 family methylenomycin A resistance protein-like MFS transporter